MSVPAPVMLCDTVIHTFMCLFCIPPFFSHHFAPSHSLKKSLKFRPGSKVSYSFVEDSQHKQLFRRDLRACLWPQAGIIVFVYDVTSRKRSCRCISHPFPSCIGRRFFCPRQKFLWTYPAFQSVLGFVFYLLFLFYFHLEALVPCETEMQAVTASMKWKSSMKRSQ